MNSNTIYQLFFWLTVVTIISQTIHTWYVFQCFSKLTGFIKLFQAVLFCGIISVAIFAFVMVGEEGYALFGATIEVIINIYYYAIDFFEKGITARTRKMQAIAKFWRKNWAGLFFAVLLPFFIYVFAKRMIELQ